MKQLTYEIDIKAPKQAVWDVMLGDETFRDWASEFMPGTHYEGDWEQGSRIAFVAPDEAGKLGGIVGRVIESRPPSYVCVEYYGLIEDGDEVTSGEDVDAWIGATESYTLDERDGVTNVTVQMEVTPDDIEEMDKAWPMALQRLKELAED